MLISPLIIAARGILPRTCYIDMQQNIGIVVFAFLMLIVSQLAFGQSDSLKPIEHQSISTDTGSKPQSKVWKYKEDFYSVFPNSSGTYVWQLVRNQWVQHLQLSKKSNSKADCYAVSDTVFILLFQGQLSEFATLKYAEQQYQFLNPTNRLSKIVFDASTETATIAFDSRSILWMTYEAENRIEVRTSISPYTSWSRPVTLSYGVSVDDICSIVTMSNSVGVLWSNQNSQRFGFRLHVDGDPVSLWSNDEVPASQSALNIGHGMADDHINIKFTLDGALYAAVKTSYDTPSYSKIGLLVRRSNSLWDKLYHVSYEGTRPITTIDLLNKSIKVYYTSIESGGDIVYKESSMDLIEFSQKMIFLEGSNYNNASSTKFPHYGHNLVLASDDHIVAGNVIDCR